MNHLSFGGSLVAIFLMILIGFCLVEWISTYTCQKRWARSGFESSWAYGQGCVVKLPNGHWIPEKVVRTTDLAGSR